MQTTQRLHSLDALRGLALLLGIVLHATMSFFFFLPAQDVSQSTTLAVTFFVIHIFRMSVFYLIAGFFAHLVFHRRGARAFVKDRAKRIVVPMIAGWVILAPLTIGAVIWGLSRTFPEASADDMPAPQGLPLTHLWFLYYLCIFYVAALALRAGVVALDKGEKIRTRVDGVVRAGISSYLAPLALAVPTIAVLFADKAWAVWFGIHTPDTGFTPQLPALVAYGSAFAFGWLMHRQSDLLATLEKQWQVNLTLAVALTAACLAWIGPTPNLLDAVTVPGGLQARLAYTAGYALAIWYWTFGLLGASVRFFSQQSPVRRYLADASYWFYLIHLPIVFALQVVLMKVPLHWTLKFPLILAITLSLLLASYHYLVRSTFVGEILNGRRHPRRPRRSPHSPKATDGEATSTPVGAFRAEATEELAIAASAEGALPIAELVHVTKRYGKTVALDDLSLSVRQGELLAVLGPNGAGKSTAIGLWLGTLQPDDGEDTVVQVLGGAPLETTSRLAVGVMMQEVTLAPMLTAREQVTLAASYYRDPLPIAEILAFANIEALADKRYGKLSAGQKRQVQFAVAIAGRPRLLFLDEPTVGLDIAARETMWKNIRRLVGDGCSIVLTTHYLEEAEMLADRVAVLANGRLIAEGSVDEMRSLVTRKRIRCASALEISEIQRWPGVVEAVRNEENAALVHVTASDAETVVRRLLAADPDLSQLEVQKASLAEAFTEITKEAA